MCVCECVLNEEGKSRGREVQCARREQFDQQSQKRASCQCNSKQPSALSFCDLGSLCCAGF
uniref:THO complex subunit 3 isoform X1 n=1 Tax=Rhizophora mucronata TaxID=61149 RepID=A0A2P2JSR7_RHIMU